MKTPEQIVTEAKFLQLDNRMAEGFMKMETYLLELPDNLEQLLVALDEAPVLEDET